jgi:hypothetical protein
MHIVQARQAHTRALTRQYFWRFADFSTVSNKIKHMRSDVSSCTSTFWFIGSLSGHRNCARLRHFAGSGQTECVFRSSERVFAPSARTFRFHNDTHRLAHFAAPSRPNPVCPRGPGSPQTAGVGASIACRQPAGYATVRAIRLRSVSRQRARSTKPRTCGQKMVDVDVLVSASCSTQSVSASAITATKGVYS